MKPIAITFLLGLLAFTSNSQTIPVTDNLVAEGIPPLSSQLAADVKNYTESRGAGLVDWHPLRKEMLISTRFANTNQLHYVKMPGGDRKQITFFDEPIGSATFEPAKGEYFLFLKDVGGNEFAQIYRYDMSSKKVTLLTDGKRSQNGGIEWSEKGDRIAYGSTRRNGEDRDVYLMNPLDPSSDKLVAELPGGGWSVADWAPDDTRLLLEEGISINESRLYLLDLKTGERSRLIPEKDERTSYEAIGFTKDGKGIYLATTKDNEFNQLAYLDLATKKMTPLTSSIPWDVDDADLSPDGKQLAFSTNENGLSKMYILSTSNNKFQPVPGIPTGVLGGLSWSSDSKSIGFTFNAFNSSADAFEYNTTTKQLTRWTESEVGGIDISMLQAPELVTWKSF